MKKESQKIVRFDWAMKHLLRNKANYDIIEGFLSALLNDNDITVLELIESESNTDDKDGKFNRVDVMIKDGNNRKIIIEIQNTRESDYLERILFGTSKTISESISSGFRFGKIDKVISISILYFNLGIGKDYLYHGETIFKGMSTKEELKKIQAVLPDNKRYRGIDKFPEYYLIQVEKYKNVISNAIDEWIYWFKNEAVEEQSSSKNIDKVREKLRVLSMTKEERKNYNRYLERLASEEDMIETAKNDGIKEAEEKLLPKIEKERRQKKETQIKLAKKMLKYNESIEEIIEETGLSREDIVQLKTI